MPLSQKDQTPSAFPLFYQAPRPLDKERDAALKISPPANFSFASRTNAIPLFLNEFPLAAPFYPIVFVGNQRPLPALVLGIRNEENLFVDKKGAWFPHLYVPAYVRRYPFILMEDRENKQFIFCLDEKSDMLSCDSGTPLFDGEAPSSFTQNAMKLCADLHQQGEAALAFVAALQEHKLLVQTDVKAEMPDKTVFQLSGLWVVDPQRFEALPDNIYLDWRRKGWIALLYAHLFSLHHWSEIIALTQENHKPAGDPI